MQPNKLGLKIREIREKNKLGTLKTFAPRLGISNNTLASYELGTVLPDVDFLINFSEETNTDFDELLNLRIEVSPATKDDVEKASSYFIASAQRHLKIEQTLRNYQVDEQGKLIHKFTNVDDVTDTIYIESYPEVRGAAGSGQLTPTDQVVINIAVNAADWRNYVGLDHKHIKVIAVHGDSMKPTLSHGDQVLVDTACHRFVDDAIYAIQQGDLTRFKRIKLRLDGSIEVKSDNDKEGFKLEIYNATEAAEFKLIGRVIPFKFGRFDL